MSTKMLLNSASQKPTASFCIAQAIKGSFIFAVLLNVLSFLKSINLAVVFSSAARVEQEPLKTRKKSSNHRKSRKSKQQKALFPDCFNVDKSLKSNASVVPCSTSYDASFVPVKSQGQIHWNLSDVNIDINSSTEDFFNVNESNKSNDDSATSNNHQQLELPDFLTNSATCSTASDSSSVVHHDNTHLQTIPNYQFQNNKNISSNQQNLFRNSVISSSDNDDTSLNEIDLDQLTDFTNFGEFDASTFTGAENNIIKQEETLKDKNEEVQVKKENENTPAVQKTPELGEQLSIPEIATPEIKQTSKSESNTPNKLENSPNSSHYASSSISSSPEIDGVDYTFTNSLVGHEGDEDFDENELEEEEEEELDEKGNRIAGISGTKKNPAKSHACPFCPAEFRIRGYLTRHIKKHAVQKAYTCPFYNPNAEHKCHPNGGFSRRDTYKTHLKARHFRYPPGTRSQDRSHVGGKCGVCGTTFETNENWVENHIENGACPGLPVGYQCRSANSRRKKNKAKFLHNESSLIGMPAGMNMGIGIQPNMENYVGNMKAYQFYEQQRQLQQLQMQQFQAQQQQQQQQQQMFSNVNGNNDIMQRSISPLDGIYQQRTAAQHYIPQQPRHNQIQQHMFEIQVQQAQQVAFQQAQQAALQAAQMNQQQKQQQQQQKQQHAPSRPVQQMTSQVTQQQPQQQFLVEDEDFMALADEYSPSYNENSNSSNNSANNVTNNSNSNSSVEDENQFSLDNEIYFSDQQFQFNTGDANTANGNNIHGRGQDQGFEYSGHQTTTSQSQMNFFENNTNNFAVYQQSNY